MFGRDKYGKAFYSSHGQGMVRSAEVVLPAICSRLRPTSMVDVGCGSGAWLRAAAKVGVRDLHGIEGKWAQTMLSEFGGFQFHFVNLNNTIQLHRRFDLAISMEVAEHLLPQRSQTFIVDLCRLSDCVLFSAAIPGQGGTGHSNERWHSFWFAQFEQNDYVALDVLRPLLWDDDRVEFWYRQNAVLFVHDARISEVAPLFSDLGALSVKDVVHPKLLERKENRSMLQEMKVPLRRYSGHA